MESERNTAAYVWHPQIASRSLDGAAFVLLHSRMVSFNATATRIWELFESGAAVDDVAARIADEFDTTPQIASRDTAQFVETLVERGMLVPFDAASPTDSPRRAEGEGAGATPAPRASRLKRSTDGGISG